MPSSTLSKFNQFIADLHNGAHNLGTHSLKIMLTNTAPVASNAVKADIAEIAAGNGYTAGGVAFTVTSSSQTGGAYKLIGNDPVITATGPSTGAIGPFRYAVLYNDTQTSPAKPLIGWLDYGSSISLGAGESFTFDSSQVNGILSAT